MDAVTILGLLAWGTSKSVKLGLVRGSSQLGSRVDAVLDSSMSKAERQASERK